MIRGRLALASLVAVAGISLSAAAAVAQGAAGDLLPVSGPNGETAGFAINDEVPASSGTGEFVAFLRDGPSTGGEIPFPGGSGVFLRSLRAPELIPVTVSSGESGGNGYDAGSPSLDREGRCLAFVSEDPEVSDEDKDFSSSAAGTSPNRDAFVYDRSTGKISLVSRRSGPHGAAANDDSNLPEISEDGRYVAFGTEANNLVPGKVVYGGVYVRDLRAKTTTLVSREDGAGGKPIQGYEPSISRKGAEVAFAQTFGHKKGRRIVIALRDVKRNRTTVVSRASGRGGAVANADCGEASLSAGGRYVAFASKSTNLVRADDDRVEDVFVRDLKTGRTALVSRSQGRDGAPAHGDSSHPSISADGRYVAFESYASDLGPGDQGRFPDVFVRDMRSGRVYLASRASHNGPAANGPSGNPSISASGHFVAFESRASNLSPEDTDRALSVFRYQILP